MLSALFTVSSAPSTLCSGAGVHQLPPAAQPGGAGGEDQHRAGGAHQHQHLPLPHPGQYHQERFEYRGPDLVLRIVSGNSKWAGSRSGVYLKLLVGFGRACAPVRCAHPSF